MAAIDDTLAEKANWHWRNTMRPARFFNLDARAALPFCILLVYLRWSSVIFAISVTVIFYMFERRGLTFPAALRSIRLSITGRKRPGLLPFRHRRMRDYGAS